MFDIFYKSSPPNIAPFERPANSIQDAAALCRTRFFWFIDGDNDYSTFDFDWNPPPWEDRQIHVWPSQHQENGGTYFSSRILGQDINRNHDIVVRKKHAPVVGIDHGNGIQVPCDTKTRYISDYLGTLRRVLSKLDHEYVWVVSSVCDYTNFDFTWHPSEWQQDMLHVFPSSEQKFGDTFYVHVPSFMKKTENLALLEWFDTLRFVDGISVPRLPVPVIRHDHDSVVPAVWQHNFQDPVIQFARYQPVNEHPSLNLWREQTKAVIPLTNGAGSVLVPRETKNYLQSQIYDYPILDKSFRHFHSDPAQDIIFISNGESNAERNWQNLQKVTAGSSNNLIRIDGIDGRSRAYQAAAEASSTDWFFAVFAKLEVVNGFDWAWQPDRLQEAKHYIFNARNPVNGLEYGHMGVIAYNRRLVLETTDPGLDFTLSRAHDVVPVLSAIAHFNADPWMTWRTAFREVLKLRYYQDQSPSIETEHRLKIWTTVAQGDNAEWCLQGARDAVDYYNEVSGKMPELMLSFDWAWLRERFQRR